MTSEIGQQVILSAQKLNVYYGEFNAVKDVDIDTVSYTHLTLPTKA